MLPNPLVLDSSAIFDAHMVWQRMHLEVALPPILLILRRPEDVEMHLVRRADPFHKTDCFKKVLVTNDTGQKAQAHLPRTLVVRRKALQRWTRQIHRHL